MTEMKDVAEHYMRLFLAKQEEEWRNRPAEVKVDRPDSKTVVFVIDDLDDRIDGSYDILEELLDGLVTFETHKQAQEYRAGSNDPCKYKILKVTILVEEVSDV